ncbi:MAG: DUF1598 domain-containing protein [Planctomycetota bacterium]|nr:DUF1598 domain-containing protein [Planctomycetota bacterium]
MKTAESDQEKDRILAEIARAQQKNGLTTQSLSTIARMGSDIARSASLDQFKRSGFGSKLGEGLDWEANREGNRRTANGAGGGAAMADFDPLIELIQNTIDPQSWMDTNGGPGTINEFRAGVTVDAEGVLQKVDYSIKQGILKDILKESSRKSTNLNVFKDSELRKISLNRLEKKCQILAAAGKSPSEVMERLAGIYEIKYLLVYPESGDIVIAGPGGDWRTDVEGVAVNIKTGRPLFRLDDLVVCLRNAIEFNGKFGCSIDPRQANLIATQQFASTSDLKGKRWREGLQNALGFQDITVDGIDPQSVVARVIVEADYRMKLVGVGLEKSVPGVESFLSKVSLDADGNVPPTDVMRLEFMLNYDNISVTEDKDAYQLHGQGVKVVSEKELLNQKGERFQTGKSEGPAAEFARGFTKHFPAMAKRYPIYAQLKNVFDLAMVSNLIRSQGIDKICKWNMTYFGPEKNSQQTYLSRKGSIPREVKSVMNYREIDVRENGRTIKTQLIVGISGGVSVDVEKLIQSREMIKKDTYGKLKIDRKIAKPTAENWWWD